MRAWGGPESRLRLSGLVSGNLKKGEGLERREGNMQNTGLDESLIVTWLEGFWDFGEEGKLGSGCGCMLWYCESIRFTVTAPLPAIQQHTGKECIT